MLLFGTPLTAIIFALIYFISLASLMAGWVHVLWVLICLEFMALMLFMSMSIFWSNSEEMFYSLVFLAASACESVLGVSTMLVMVKSYGSGQVSGQNVSLW